MKDHLSAPRELDKFKVRPVARTRDDSVSVTDGPVSHPAPVAKGAYPPVGTRTRP